MYKIILQNPAPCASSHLLLGSRLYIYVYIHMYYNKEIPVTQNKTLQISKRENNASIEFNKNTPPVQKY